MCDHYKINILESNIVSYREYRHNIHSYGYQGIFIQVQNSTVGLYEVEKR